MNNRYTLIEQSPDRDTLIEQSPDRDTLIEQSPDRDTPIAHSPIFTLTKQSILFFCILLYRTIKYLVYVQYLTIEF